MTFYSSLRLSANLVLRATKSHVWESDLLIGLSGIMPHGGISRLVSQAQLIVLRSGLVAVLREKQNARKTKIFPQFGSSSN